jgi:hypothetical protein
MAKYDPLQRFLSRQKTECVMLSFREIEAMIGGLLPKGAETPDWWAADSVQNPKAVQAAAWARAGYSATLLKGEDRVRFHRTGRS